MKNRFSHLFALVLVILFLNGCNSHSPSPDRESREGIATGEEWMPFAPDAWMYSQRAFPHREINYAVAIEERESVQKQTSLRSGHSEPWSRRGPINVGGRITSLAVPPNDMEVIFAGTTGGGLYRSQNKGETWDVVFAEPGAYSIGDVALCSALPSVVYLGTGEANASATSGAFFGNGIYKSEDSGDSWEYLGLKESHHIGRLAVDPVDPQRVFAAATGKLYSKNETRGVFRSLDGGESWENVLFISDSTACIDIVMHPKNTDTLYAAFWERVRYPDYRSYSGPTSGIYRTYDGGENWENITEGIGSDTTKLGRLGIAIAPSNPDVLYVSATEDPSMNVHEGIYLSTNNGDSWKRMDDGSIDDIYRTFGWFFGRIITNPFDASEVYVLGLETWVSQDSGRTWNLHTFSLADEVHVDQHAMIIHPADPDFHIAGNDGGIYLSEDAGVNWYHVQNVDNNLFYTCTIDPSDPERIYGGLQDNGTVRTLTGSDDDWERILGGDGFYVQVDPTDPLVIYCEFQWGNLFRTDDGGFNMSWITPPLADEDRTNWSTPIILDPSDPSTIYYGSQQMWRSNERGDPGTWIPISPDLTNQEPGTPGGAENGTISTIAVSPTDPETIYVGTDDGYVQVTFDGGNSWNLVSGDLPLRYVTRVAIDPYDAMTAYVTFSGYRFADYLPHIFRTTDGGESWTDISSNLPEVPLNDVIVDPELEGVLYVASDLGVWYTEDLGNLWQPLGIDLPSTVINDLDLHNPSRTLCAASFGRSMHSIKLAEPTSTKSEISTEPEVSLSPNPARDLTQVLLRTERSGACVIVVFDSSGREIVESRHEYFNAGAFIIDLETSALTPGVYYVKCTLDGAVKILPLIIQ